MLVVVMGSGLRSCTQVKDFTERFLGILILLIGVRLTFEKNKGGEKERRLVFRVDESFRLMFR